MSKNRIYYVDASAHFQGDGSKDRPFKHINDAAKIAVAGDEVLVRPGIYREWVCPVNAMATISSSVLRTEMYASTIISLPPRN